MDGNAHARTHARQAPPEHRRARGEETKAEGDAGRAHHHHIRRHARTHVGAGRRFPVARLNTRGSGRGRCARRRSYLTYRTECVRHARPRQQQQRSRPTPPSARAPAPRRLSVGCVARSRGA
eukprot:scaffold2462_cov402-Prasinococcus_capsulatus_cf.AAC.21